MKQTVVLLGLGLVMLTFTTVGCESPKAPATSSSSVQTIDDILHLDNDVDIIIALSDRIQDKIKQSGFESLTPAEKTFYYVDWLEREINNGGFDQYFFNSAGDHAQEVIGALEEIKAAHTAQLVREAMSVFPRGVAPRDRNQRQEELLNIGEQGKAILDQLDNQFYEYHDPLSQLLIQYVRQNRAQFQ